MSNTNQQLRDGIEKIAGELEFIVTDGSLRTDVHVSALFRHYAGGLRKLLEAGERTHPDTERLEFLMARYNMTREGVDTWSRQHAELAPTFRPWTAEEAPGKLVRRKADRACVRMVMHKVHLAFVLSDGTVWPETELAEHWEVSDGTPCGVEVKAK